MLSGVLLTVAMAVPAAIGSPKVGVFFTRYLTLVRWLETIRPDQDEAEVTIDQVAAAWDCSPRAAQQTLRRLAAWGLLRWQPGVGRGHRSRLRLHVHPVHVYFQRAQQAEGRGALAEAAFWLSEILRECPCLPEVPALLADVRRRLGVRTTPCC